MIGGYKSILGKLYIVPGKVIGRAPGGFLLIHHRLRQYTQRRNYPITEEMADYNANYRSFNDTPMWEFVRFGKRYTSAD
jgi:hypothetical protein